MRILFFLILCISNAYTKNARDFKLELEALEMATAAEPKNHQLLVQLVVAYSNLGQQALEDDDNTEAAAYLRKALNIAPRQQILQQKLEQATG